jgi:hypothetical protein
MCNDPIGQIHTQPIIENPNRLRMSKFTKRELEIMVSALALDKGLDFLTGGAINRWSRRQAVNIVKKVLPAALRTAAVPAASIARSALPLAMNPYVAGAALGYGALQTQPGQQLLEAAAESGADTRRSLDMALFNVQALGEEKVKRTKSKFNKAVSKGLQAVKAGTSYGKKGVINAPKKAFAAVTKMASKINKAKKEKRRFPKAPKSPNAKKIYKSILGVLK